VIDAAALRRHFPVHALLGPDLEVRQLGPTLERLLGADARRSFDALFALERPTLDEVSIDRLRALGPALCVVRFKPTALPLRCEFVPTEDGSVLLLGSPSVHSVDALAGLQLGFADFPAHDPTADFLMVLGTHRATLDDLRELTEKQRRQRRALEETNARLEAANEEARRASAVKSRFLAHMSHELRTPLHAISGLAHLLREDPNAPRSAEYIDGIHSSAQLLVSLIGQVLDLAKIESGRMELQRAPFSLAESLGAVFQPQQARAQFKELTFDWRIDAPADTWLLGDALRLQQICLNLVGNSVKFTERGGISVRVALAAGRLRIDVQDTGPGLTEEELARLFQPYAQASRVHDTGGTGLGLSLSRELAQLMGGTVSAACRVGEGCVFTVELPVEVTPRPVVSPVAGSPVQRPLRVLLVDDNAINRLLGERLLVREGHSVRVSTDGVDALALLEAGRFDVILMDVQMPTLDGLEVTRRLRARGDRTPVIALTANAVLGVREACLEAGMNDYVAKPIELVTLRAALLRLTSPAPGGGE